jgi:hypothetical protein
VGTIGSAIRRERLKAKVGIDEAANIAAVVAAYAAIEWPAP